MLIPEATIQKIKDEAEITQIIGEFVKLEKSGANYIGLCPFHDDKNPSLSVSPSKKIFKCFSCGASGNVFSFVQNHRQIPFIEAVKYVGEKCGIPVETGGTYEYSQKYEKYYKILQTATNFYEFYLKNTSEGQEAQEYLHKRNLNDKIIKRFRIGLAPNGDLLYQSLLKDQFQPLDMIEAGVVRSSSNQYYDVFRNRIIFPLDNLEGHIVGFSGRIFQNAKTGEPKYLNSSENVVFQKGSILYNYYDSQNEIRQKDHVYLFEGFMDVIAAYQASINNAIASMGTALTAQQIRAISKLTKNITICFDGDNPGIEASKKAILQCQSAGLNTKAVFIPEGLDPDDYLKKFGKKALKDLLENQSLSGLDFLYLAEKKNYNPNDVLSLESFKKAVFRILKIYKSQVLTEKFLERLANDLNVSLESIQADYSNSVSITFQTPVVIIPEAFKPTRRIKKRKYEDAERALIRYSYQKKEYCSKIRSELGLEHVNIANFQLMMKIEDYYKKNENMNESEFYQGLNPEEIKLLNEVLTPKLNHEISEIDKFIKVVQNFKIEKRIQQLTEKPNKDQKDLEEIQKLKKELTNNLKE